MRTPNELKNKMLSDLERTGELQQIKIIKWAENLIKKQIKSSNELRKFQIFKTKRRINVIPLLNDVFQFYSRSVIESAVKEIEQKYEISYEDAEKYHEGKRGLSIEKCFFVYFIAKEDLIVPVRNNY